MAIDADTLLDRMQLKQQLARWRTITIVTLMGAAILLINRDFGVSEIASKDYIARLSIDGIISEDRKMIQLIEDVADAEHIKAAIVYLDSPGGTVLGGEEYYLAFKRLSKRKPVVVLMRSLCTSACYLTAIGADRLFAREGTLTGSIGVIMQSAQFTDMAESLGIKPIIIKSGENKATPNPLAELEPEQRQLAQNVVDDFFRYFLELVKTERNLNEEQLTIIKDGRVFTGRQALEMQLIDTIGGEYEALAWLEESHQLDPDLTIKDVKPKREEVSLFSRLNSFTRNAIESAENLTVSLDGLTSIWHASGSLGQ